MLRPNHVDPGVAGDDGDRAIARQPRFFVGFILILVFAGVPGLYGLIVALLLNTKGDLKSCHAAPYNPCCDAGILGYQGGSGAELGCYSHTF